MIPDKKGVCVDLQSVMWNLSRRSMAYLACNVLDLASLGNAANVYVGLLV